MSNTKRLIISVFSLILLSASLCRASSHQTYVAAIRGDDLNRFIELGNNTSDVIISSHLGQISLSDAKGLIDPVHFSAPQQSLVIQVGPHPMTIAIESLDLSPQVNLFITEGLGQSALTVHFLSEHQIIAGRVDVQAGQILAEGNINAAYISLHSTHSTEVRGVLNATGIEGGIIHVLGWHVLLTGRACLDASGELRGGAILIGGNKQGLGPLPNAQGVFVGEEVYMGANANSAGDGGEIVVFAEKTAEVHGRLHATSLNGSNGLIEVSGQQNWSFPNWQQRVKGDFLIDPTDITIQIGSVGAIAGSPVTANILGASDISDYLQNSGNLTITTSSAGADAGDITLNSNAAIIWSSGNSLTIIADRKINLSSGSSITCTGDGDITLEANLAGTATGNFNGIFLNSATISTNFGSIFLTGKGGIAGSSGTTNNGVRLEGASTITSTSGNITLHGTGGSSSTIFGETYNIGVALITGSQVAAGGTGNISITGISGSGTERNYGVEIQGEVLTVDGGISIVGDARLGAYSGGINVGIVMQITPLIQSTGQGHVSMTGYGGNGPGVADSGILMFEAEILTDSGNITLNGTAGSTDIWNVGVYIGERTTSTIRSTSGSISITGQGGAGTSNNYGIMARNGSSILAPAGNITLNGTAGAGTGNNNVGIALDNSPVIQAGGSGQISLTGVGSHGSGNDDDGILMYSGQIRSDFGNIIMNGTAGNTASWNVGVFIGYTLPGTIQSDNGSIFITGLGGSGHSNNHGIIMRNGSDIVASIGKIVLRGTSNTGTGERNKGVIITGAGTTVTTGSNSLDIYGQGGTGTGSLHLGIEVSGNETTIIGSTNGSIRMWGTGGTGNGETNRGITFYHNTRVTTSGNIYLDGTGGIATRYCIGIATLPGSQIVATGAGTITMIGQGGNGSGQDHWGIEIQSATVQTNSGNILMNGRGGDSGTNYNHGIRIHGSSNVFTAGGNTTVNGTAGTGADSYDISWDNPTIEQGGGDCTFNGQVVSTGNVTANSGTNGVFFREGGTIGGTAIFNNSGSVGIGTRSLPNFLTIGNGLTINGATLEMYVNGNTPSSSGPAMITYSQLLVTGAVNLTSAGLKLFSDFGFGISAGDILTLVNNDGTGDAVTGAFSGYADESTISLPQGDFRISYDGFNNDDNDIIVAALSNFTATVPTVSEWGMIILALGLIIGATVMIRRYSTILVRD